MCNIEQTEVKLLESLHLSESTRRNYVVALHSRYLKEMVTNICKTDSLYKITDLDELWKLYSAINIHPVNVKAHRVYSAMVMKYIRFLNGGQKYGKRIDHKKTKRKTK
jgi:hypothetical protein